MLRKIKDVLSLLKSFKEWYDGLGAEKQGNYKVVLVIFAVFAIFGVAMTAGFNGGKKHHKHHKPHEKAIVCNDPAHQGIIAESPVVYADTVFVVAVHRGTTVKSAHSYTEIIFGHDLYLYYSEVSGSVRHYDYNSPVYVTEGDLCVLRVEKKGEKETTVTLVENLSKGYRNVADDYFCSSPEDSD